MSNQHDHWLAVIAAAPTRRDARLQLGCTFNELKAFRAAHMPDHKWPNTKTDEDVGREKFEQRQRKRLAQ